MEIFLLLCDGLNNKDIAVLLGISVRTVESHRDNIYTKILSPEERCPRNMPNMIIAWRKAIALGFVKCPCKCPPRDPKLWSDFSI